MNYCPCCKDILLRYTQRNGISWFCRSCWQAMPVSTYKQSISSIETISGEFNARLNLRNKPNSLVSYKIKNTVPLRQKSVNLSSRLYRIFA